MTIKELFDKNKGSKINEWNRGVLREFFTYEDYITYLNNYFGDKVVEAIINGKLKKHLEDAYSLDVEINSKNPKIYIKEGFWWDVVESNGYRR